MLKFLTSLFSIFCLGFTFVFGAMQGDKVQGPPPRKDLLDDASPGALIKLNRAKHILASLVPDPESYHLILSSRSSMGGEAVPPFVYSEKPTIILYQGALSPDRSNEEIAFMMAHELGHLNLHHNEHMGEIAYQIFENQPIKMSGHTFVIFYQKLQEREADLFGLELYKRAGYDLNFFPFTLNLIKLNPNIHYGTTHIFATKEPPSLSMKDSHFSMQERFELLTHLAKKDSSFLG